MDMYDIAKTGNYFESNLEGILDGTCSVNGDGSLHINNCHDNMEYMDDTDWIVNTEIRVNKIGNTTIGACNSTLDLGRKEIEYNDDKISLDKINYKNNSILQIQIRKTENTLTWNITDEQDNTQNITLDNYTHNPNEKLTIQGNDADIDLLSYTRLTQLEE